MSLRDRVVGALAHAVLRVFFRRVEVVGGEHVPPRGPVVFVGNHGNALVDPFAAIAFLPRVPRFLAKSTLWRNPAVRPLLALAGSIPVYRAQDGTDTSRNEATFARCFEVLEQGGAIALFPEGISHDEPALQPLKTGAARIALGAARRPRSRAVAVVPVGLTFEDKPRFRSRVLVRVGPPIDLAPFVARADADERDAVRALTDAIREALAGVVLEYASWDDARLVDAAVDVFARTSDAAAMPGRGGLGERFSLRQRFGAAYERLRAREPARVDAVRAEVERYLARLERLGVRDDQLMARYPRREVLRYLRGRVPWLPLWLPVAGIGLVLNYVPYRAAGLVANLVRDTPDQPATFKLLGGFFLFPVAWGALAWWASRFGAAAALYAFALAPATGWAALLFHERTESLGREVRAFLMLRVRADEARRLRAMRAGIERDIAQLGVLDHEAGLAGAAGGAGAGAPAATEEAGRA
ncbi:MAG: lysophospholipid acyltransferase family protein [Myxococcota bacterium]